MLRIAVGRSGYGALKLGENEGIGVASVSSQERASPTWTACVAHVKVDPKSGEVTLKKLTVAMDVGTVVNPDGVRAQIEGSTLWGASIAMLEKATMAIAEEFAQGPTLAHAATKELAHIAVNDGVAAADEAMARVQAPIWASEDLKAGLASFRKNGPGLAKFAGR